MKRDAALRKILACLRLSKSSNPNEAAAALRQAQALMQKYSLTADDAEALEIRESVSQAKGRGTTPPQSIVWLINLVARGYSCAPVLDATHSISSSSYRVRFFGPGTNPEIAAYAFTVLFRQLNAARTKHIARVRKRANRERRGEEFAIGWVHAVDKLFPTEKLTDEAQRTINRAIELVLPHTHESRGRDLTKRGRAAYGDRAAGFIAGTEAQLHKGVGGSTQAQLEHSS